MKIHFQKSILLLTMFFSLGKSYAQTWPWAQSSSGEGEGYSVAADYAGNVFVTGTFSQTTLAFGPYTLINTNNAGNSGDVFLAKYDVNGNIQWAKSAGGNGYDMGMNVAVDPSGSVYITGNFTSPTMTFGSITLTNPGTQSAFIAKYDAAGNVIWASNPTTAGGSSGNGISSDPSGNIFVSGTFNAASISFGLFTLTGSAMNDCFLVKYDASGNVQWAKGAAGTLHDMPQDVSADMNGNAYVTGFFASPSLTFGTNTLINSGGYSVFLTKYDSAGNNLWAKESMSTGTYSSYGYSVAADPFGNVFITGNYTDTIAFDSDTLTCAGFATSSADNDQEVFTVKYEGAGNVLWAKGSKPLGPSTFTHTGYSIATDVNGNAYVVGGFFTPNSTAQIIFDTDTLTANNGDAMFIVKYGPFGNILCADYLTSGGDDNNGVCTDDLGDVYVTSDFYEDTFVVGMDTLHTTVGEQVFVAKYHCSLVDVNEESENGELKIYPNPSDGKFQLEINNSQNQKSEIEIYNVMGEIILNQKLQTEKTEIDISNQAAGIYFVRIVSGNKIYSGKVVKE